MKLSNSSLILPSVISFLALICSSVGKAAGKSCLASSAFLLASSSAFNLASSSAFFLASSSANFLASSSAFFLASSSLIASNSST